MKILLYSDTLRYFNVVILVLWACSVIYYLISAYCLHAFFRKGRQAANPGADPPPATVLKPLRGADENTYENLKSFVMQDYPEYQVVFGVMDKDDPACAVARRLIAENPDKDLELVVSGQAIGSNRKVANLAGMREKAKFDIIVIADSDMRVGPDYLAAVAAGFADPAVGLVTCPYAGIDPRTPGAALEALTINTDFLPSVAVAERLEGLSFALGATMAVRKKALDDIGGLKALADYLADDYQLGNKVKKAGYKLKLSHYVVGSVQGDDTVGKYFIHQLRWGRTYRICRPGGYFLSVLTRGTAFSLCFLAASGFSPAGWAVFLYNIALRLSQAYYFEKEYGRRTGTMKYLWLLPVKDLMGFVIWALSFTGSRVTWDGREYRVDAEGRMSM